MAGRVLRRLVYSRSALVIDIGIGVRCMTIDAAGTRCDVRLRSTTGAGNRSGKSGRGGSTDAGDAVRRMIRRECVTNTSLVRAQYGGTHATDVCQRLFYLPHAAFVEPGAQHAAPVTLYAVRRTQCQGRGSVLG